MPFFPVLNTLQNVLKESFESRMIPSQLNDGSRNYMFPTIIVQRILKPEFKFLGLFISLRVSILYQDRNP